MSHATQTTRYLENDVMSRSPEWLVPLLYEHLLTNLRRAAIQIRNDDVAGRSESLGRASAIVGELLATLDQEKGGQLARHLSGLYSYFVLEILNVGRSPDGSSLPKLIELVDELHGAWVEAAKQVAPGRSTSSAEASAA
jgi:flagellar secretion chaperone FliS